MRFRPAIPFSLFAARILPAAAAILFFVGCKPQATSPVVVAASPSPTVAPRATADKKTSTSPAPLAGALQKGVLCVTKPFSVADDSGIYGFPVGTRVTLVRADGDELTVTDGVRTGKAPRTSFSGGAVTIARNRPAPTPPQPQASAAPQPPSPAAEASPAPHASLFSLMAAVKQKRYLAEKEVAAKKKREQLAREISELTARIAAAEQEASGKQSRQVARHYDYDAYGYAYSYSPTSAYSLSADASNIGALRTKLAACKEEFAGLPEVTANP